VHPVSLDAPIISRPGAPAISAVGTSLVVHEWTGSGPSYMHIHRSDDEAWHVLEGSLRFRFADGEVDALRQRRKAALSILAGLMNSRRPMKAVM
jgi:hypothetical protein